MSLTFIHLTLCCNPLLARTWLDAAKHIPLHPIIRERDCLCQLSFATALFFRKREANAAVCYAKFLSGCTAVRPKGVDEGQRIVGFVGREAAKDDVPVVHQGVRSKGDLEQGAVGVWAAVAHRQTAGSCVTKDEVLVLEQAAVVVDAPGAVSLLVQQIARLEKVARNDSVYANILVVVVDTVCAITHLASDERHKIIHCHWTHVVAQLKDEATEKPMLRQSTPSLTSAAKRLNVHKHKRVLLAVRQKQLGASSQRLKGRRKVVVAVLLQMQTGRHRLGLCLGLVSQRGICSSSIHRGRESDAEAEGSSSREIGAGKKNQDREKWI